MFDVHVLAATQAWWQGLLALLWTIFVDLAVPVMVTLILALIAKYLHFSVSDRQRKKIDEYVDKAVDYADQKLKKVLKEGEAPKDANAQRMQWAKEFLEQVLIGTGLLKKAEAKLEDLIEARLGRANKPKSVLKSVLTTEKKGEDSDKPKSDD